MRLDELDIAQLDASSLLVLRVPAEAQADEVVAWLGTLTDRTGAQAVALQGGVQLDELTSAQLDQLGLIRRDELAAIVERWDAALPPDQAHECFYMGRMRELVVRAQ